MEERVTLDWTYSPRDYFREPHLATLGQHELHIGEGRVQASFPSHGDERDIVLANEIDRMLRSYFQGAVPVANGSCTLSKYTMTRQRKDGTTAYYLSAPSDSFTLIGNEVDFRLTDAQGTVIRDTAAEREAEKREFARLATDHGQDPTLASILKSRENAANDPANELVHLEEIREAVGSKFGGKAKARKELKISEESWKRLGQLANDEPLSQGRHRGKFPKLRDATEAELVEARGIAKILIKSYMDYLEHLS